MRAVILLILLITACHPVLASTIPADAARYKRDLIRVSHAEWGLDAPVCQDRHECD
ncbi:hypothetical protein I2494_04515 [Budviciaceae bacterium BWR-B9]|uniref:Uncharacterized protein n=1 Tax=Limnobaculum allomyrinae TaxID=2791986 RepID=A0ABS1IMK2_9GAMM|nr:MULTISPECIES: hypothetical protein [Limnobaculum]MBK5142986.1 hypothetical protein [Limnobaculum allomyrinae]MBV7693315.1 hypothetical protein [Limnobaculum sp. M2-1]